MENLRSMRRFLTVFTLIAQHLHKEGPKKKVKKRVRGAKGRGICNVKTFANWLRHFDEGVEIKIKVTGRRAINKMLVLKCT